MQEELIDQEAVAKGKRRLILIFCSMLTLLLLGLLLYYVNCVRPVQEFRTLYATGQYEAAWTLYKEDLTRISGNARKAEQFVEEKLNTRWREYQQADISTEELEEALSKAERYPLEAWRDGVSSALQALTASRECYAEGLSLMEAGQFLEAIDCFSSMSADDVLYEEGSQKAADAAEGYGQQIAAESSALMDEGSYEEAMALTDGALERFPESETLAKQREAIYEAHRAHTRQTSLAEAQEYLNQGNLQETLRILTALERDYPDDAEITVLTGEYEAAYAGQILAQAQPLYDQGQYEAALSVLAPAHEILPEHPDILSLYDRTAGHLPAWLTSFPCENVSLRGTKKAEENAADTYGNTYGRAVVYTEPSALSMQTMTYAEGKESYSLGGAYTRLLGTAAVKEGSRGILGGQTGTLRIYGDDALLFELPGISETTEPVPFSIDVTGVETLTFSFESGIGLKYLLGDVCLYKTYLPPEEPQS